MEKNIIFTHTNPLLVDFQKLNESSKPEVYAGFIYMWKCEPENRYYIGSHKGVVNDEYRGSGRTFRRVFEHYGLTQFSRVILEYVIDVDQLKNREQAWLNKFKAVRSNNFYNQKNAVESLAI